MDSILTNGVHKADVLIPHGSPESPTIEQLEHELPVVHDGQVPLGELVSRMAQAIYAELTELAETMPHMPDSQRKRTLAEWVVKTKKQVVKLYVVAKWSRDAGVVQKAMNVTAFLMDQNRQFDEIIGHLRYAKDSLDPARLRNHDLLTSLDVLTTGSYRRLPSAIKKLVIPSTPLTDEQVNRTLSDIEDVMRYRLRMYELIPREMANYRISDGRVSFIAPHLFEVSVCVKGAKKGDGWFFVDAEFLFSVGGDPTGMQEFPRKPVGMLRRLITDEADARLGYYLAPEEPPAHVPPPPVEIVRPKLPQGIADAPLVRLFNFLQMMSLSYQLEILLFQAHRLRALGWNAYLDLEMSNNRKTLTLTYWLRKLPPQLPGRTRPIQKIPPFGGTLSISIIPTQPAPPLPTQPLPRRPPYSQPSSQRLDAQPPPKAPLLPPKRSPKDRVLAELQERAKLTVSTPEQPRQRFRPSDEVEGMSLKVKWTPEREALGIKLMDPKILENEFTVDPDDLDVEAILQKAIRLHSTALLTSFHMQLRHGRWSSSFTSAYIELIDYEGLSALRIQLCAEETVIISIDPRTGRLNLRDVGDLTAAGRGPKFSAVTDVINTNPQLLPELLSKLRYSTITDLAEQKARYLGFQCFRRRNFPPAEIQKLGETIKGSLFIQLASFPDHYLVLVINENDFEYALISVHSRPETMFQDLVMGDIGWLDVSRIHSPDPMASHPIGSSPIFVGPRQDPVPGSPNGQRITDSFRLETQVLRELYAYCCARVAYTKVEKQLKSRTIAYKHVNPSLGLNLNAVMSQIHSSLARSIPALCVQSSDILSGRPAAEAAMPNIRIIPLNWWTDQKAQVVTCVKLKCVQQPVGKRAGSGAVIRPSKRIIYDTREAVVTFLSEDVETCVDEFLEEWARVSKMVVIAKEIAQMSTERKWTDVRLLSFDLQTVEFTYGGDYAVSITCTDQLSLNGGSYELSFSRATEEPLDDFDPDDVDAILAQYNPHEDVEPFMRNLLRHEPLVASVTRLVALLRDTLPIVAELEHIRVTASKAGENIDTFARTMGWFRLLFADYRHALDFRLMSNARVVILDGSTSLFTAEDKSNTASAPESDIVLQPIPDFRSIVAAACKDIAGTPARRRVTPVEIGVMCESAAVRMMGRVLYERVRQRLKEGSGSGTDLDKKSAIIL